MKESSIDIEETNEIMASLMSIECTIKSYAKPVFKFVGILAWLNMILDKYDKYSEEVRIAIEELLSDARARARAS